MGQVGHTYMSPLYRRCCPCEKCGSSEPHEWLSEWVSVWVCEWVCVSECVCVCVSVCVYGGVCRATAADRWGRCNTERQAGSYELSLRWVLKPTPLAPLQAWINPSSLINQPFSWQKTERRVDNSLTFHETIHYPKLCFFKKEKIPDQSW